MAPILPLSMGFSISAILLSEFKLGKVVECFSILPNARENFSFLHVVE